MISRLKNEPIPRKMLQMITILTILWAGFGLRVFQLGDDSFWNDEAGQALAAIQPSLEQLFAVEKTHAMAMPLDYLVSRIFSHIGLAETIMRFPSVFWGTLTLAICFVLIRRIAQVKIALLATFLLSISAFHVHFSQEMRFYSALVFFYALSTYLLLRAIAKHSLSWWATFTLFCVIGTYFHPYVSLSVVNGFFYLIFWRSGNRELSRFLVLIVSALLIAAFFLPGYIFFGSHQQFNYSLSQWSTSIIEDIALGIGWMPMSYSPKVGSLRPLGILTIAFTLIGLTFAIVQRDGRMLSLLISFVIQIGLVLLADWIKGYSFTARQLIHLHPVALVFTGTGVVISSKLTARFIVGLQNRLEKSFSGERKALPLVIICVFASVLGLFNSFVLGEYYVWPKSTAKTISIKLAQDYRSESTILVVPGYEAKVYRFYFQALGFGSDLSEALYPTDWKNLETTAAQIEANAYLVTPALLTKEQSTELQRLGFVKLLGSDIEWHGAQILFVRLETSTL